MVKRIFVVILILALLGVGGYYWVYLRPTAQPDIVLAAPLASPSPASARLTGDIFAVGTVIPARYANLSMGTFGRIAEILVKEGDRVEANQPLARLDNRQQANAVVQAEANLRAAQANLAKLQAGPQAESVTMAEAAVEIAQANLDKVTKDAQDPTMINSETTVAKTVADAELRRAQAELELLRSGTRTEDLESAQAQVDGAKAEVQADQLALEATELRAPFAGTIASVNFEQGEYVAADDVVTTLSDFDGWQIASNDLDELSVVNVQVGDDVMIAFDAIPDLKLTGKVTHIKPLGTSDKGNVTYTIIVVPDQRDPRVLWNMTTQLTIKG